MRDDMAFARGHAINSYYPKVVRQFLKLCLGLEASLGRTPYEHHLTSRHNASFLLFGRLLHLTVLGYVDISVEPYLFLLRLGQWLPRDL